MTTRYLDFVGGNDANDGSTFALRKKTLSSATSGLTGGDTVRVMSSPAPTSLGQSATWTNGSDTVTLTTAVTANIDDGEAAWTASANVTATASTTTYREGTHSASLAIAAGFTTGLIAYKAFAAADYSTYQQISLLIRTSTAQAAGVLQIKLCSDNAGVTAVNTVNMPATPANTWTNVAVDTAGALGASIQSVALYAVSDPGTVTVFLDNIVAAKASSSADAITHLSLIGKNNGSATEPWFTIESINGTTVKLGTGAAGVAAKGSYATKYYGTTETVTTYKREPIQLAAQLLSASGVSLDSPLSVEFGWDTTNMSSQSDVTWVSSTDPTAAPISSSTSSYVSYNKLYAVSRGGVGLQLLTNANGGLIKEFGASGCFKGIAVTGGYECVATDIKYLVGNSYGIYHSGSCTGRVFDYTSALAWGVSATVSLVSHFIYDAGNAPVIIRAACTSIQNMVAAFGGTNASRYFIRNSVLANCLKDVTITMSGSEFHFSNSTLSGGGISSTIATKFFFNKYGQTANDHRIWWDDASMSTITSDTAQRHTPSGISWKFNPLTSVEVTSYSPLSLPVVRLACPANEARTVTLWARRDNTGLSMRLRLPGGQISGVASDVVSSMAEAANTWGGDGAGNPLSITFTPTEAGVVEILAEAWGGATFSGWVDDVGVS